jgi:DNA modification methylase
VKLGRFKLPGYYVGDCRALLRELPDESVHCVVTSPPYWALRDYGLPPVVWGGDSACEHAWGEPITMHKGGDHGEGPRLGGGRAVIEAQAAVKDARCGEFCTTCGAWQGQLGLEPSPELFVEHLVEVFAGVWRVLRPDGTLWLNLGDSYAASSTSNQERGKATPAFNGRGERQAARGWENPPRRPPPAGLKPKDLVGIPWRVALVLQSAGWWLRSDVVWHKPNPMPESVTDRPSRAHEYLFLLTKSERYHYDADAIREPLAAKTRTAFGTTPRTKGTDGLGNVKAHNWATSVTERRPRLNADGSEAGANKRTVWTIATEPTKDAHFATFPRKLVEPCVLAGCPWGGTVLDPFGGSGTVGEVAERLGRRWLLFDLGEGYARIARRRTRQAGLLPSAPPAAEGSAG